MSICYLDDPGRTGLSLFSAMADHSNEDPRMRIIWFPSYRKARIQVL